MRFILTFIILMGFWIFMSGLFDAWHFTLGVISCAIVSYISSDLLFFKQDIDETELKKMGRVLFRFLLYIPWLLYQIVVANFQIAYLALHPNMKKVIDPHIIKFKTKLKKEWSLVTFGNSITLTPGTITVSIKKDEFYVHAINSSFAKGLPGDMEKKVGRIYLEE